MRSDAGSARGRPRCGRAGWVSRRPWRQWAASGWGAYRTRRGPRRDIDSARDAPPAPLPRCRWRACSSRRPTPCRGARRPLAHRCAGAPARRRRGPARRRCPSMPCAGSARPRPCARCWRRSTPPPAVDALLLSALALLWPRRRAAVRRPHAGRPGGDRGAPARAARRPASSTRCCAASCASATRSSPQALADAAGALQPSARGGSTACAPTGPSSWQAHRSTPHNRIRR